MIEMPDSLCGRGYPTPYPHSAAWPSAVRRAQIPQYWDPDNRAPLEVVVPPGAATGRLLIY